MSRRLHVKFRLNRFRFPGVISEKVISYERNICQSAHMSKMKNIGSDQYGAEPFEQQQFGTAGVEAVNDLLI